MDYLTNLLRSDGFMPHGHCYLWIPELPWTNIISDTLIAFAYMTIPITLVYFIRKRRDIPFDWMFAAFGVFILACGSTHVMEIWTIWHPSYWLSALIKAITAVASCITAILLIKLIPVALLIPSPQQLAKVNDELRNTQAKLVSTARQAGMAEIATNVLHNIGNVLNSVNISAELVSSRVRGSKAQGLGKVAHLMSEHVDDLSDFLTGDQKGKMLPDYLLRLAEAITAEREAIIEELDQLTKGINHIKGIVAAQQAYAGASSLLEPVQLKDLFEEALKISAPPHEVTVLRELAEVPVLSLDKRRVLEILINLINNAKHAMSGVPGRQHQIILRVHWEPGKSVQIQVVDNGEGIAAENLIRIFSHGFTTRKDGHGFGLHSCVMAAHEMGGSLTVRSEGVGKGATFTLEIPIKITTESWCAG
ncbi:MULTISPECIES: ATP-binding protein [unclassified Pseudomonas]|uniref:sensor histidine kinase n=1 Tax=unclassified Pseudomonas TaxID=196821 RepID=UPI00128C4287|nr:ATP-binding protein [Pseudomonas sp. MWU12-2323]MPQ65144.1 GHKL domain-containing protein [Pseudomonas sp. MWU12-2323]